MLVEYDLSHDGEWLNNDYLIRRTHLKLHLIETDKKSSLGSDLLRLAAIFLNPEGDHKGDWEALGIFPGQENVPKDGKQEQSEQEGKAMSDVYIFDWNKAATIIKANNPKKAYAYVGSLRKHTEVTIWQNDTIMPKTPSFLISYDNFGGGIHLGCDGFATPCSVLLSNTDGWNRDTWWPASAVEILNGKKTVMEEFDGPWSVKGLDNFTFQICHTDFTPLEGYALKCKVGKLLMSPPYMLEALEMLNERLPGRTMTLAGCISFLIDQPGAASPEVLKAWDKFSAKAKAAIKKARGNE